MIAEWIVIYAVVFVLCAVVVGHIPRVRSQRQQRGRDRAAG